LGSTWLDLKSRQNNIYVSKCDKEPKADTDVEDSKYDDNTLIRTREICSNTSEFGQSKCKNLTKSQENPIQDDHCQVE